MKKIYTIEAPIYSNPLEHLIEINRSEDIGVILYGGFPDSPLNGGRYNYILDGFFMLDRLFFRISKRQLRRVRDNFYKTVSKANENGIPFLLAFTNMFVSEEELSEENLYPAKWLAENSRKYGVENGVIINNNLLEERLRKDCGNGLVYVSSCTKYVAPDRLLTPKETLNMYLEDCVRYDRVTLTPQDSRRSELIREVLRDNREKIIAITNSFCSFACNSYFHYEQTSKENKRSLLKVWDFGILTRLFAFIIPRAPKCSTFRHALGSFNIDQIARMQIEEGVANFKLGRGLGADLIDRLVSLIREAKDPVASGPV